VGRAAAARREATHTRSTHDIALFSAVPTSRRELAPLAVEQRVVIDNSNAWRMEPGVPLVVSQVNPGDAGGPRGHIANPNCSTMQLAPLLMRYATRRLERLSSIRTSRLRSGGEAIAELEAQIKAAREGRAERDQRLSTSHRVQRPARDRRLLDNATRGRSGSSSRRIRRSCTCRTCASRARPCDPGHSLRIQKQCTSRRAADHARARS